MADTYFIGATAVVPAANSPLLYIRNLHASKVIKIWRVWARNIFVGTAFTGGTCILQLNRASGYTSGGTSVTPSKNRTSSATPVLGTDMDVLKATGITGVTQGATIHQQVLHNDELTAKTTVNGEVLQAVTPLSLIWEGGYKDTNCQPLILTQNEGACLYMTTATAGGGWDLNVEMTWA